MLERVVSKTGLVYYASPLLRKAGVKHAFSTRLGGVSPAPFASLNLGNPKDAGVQDEPANIHENYRRLLEAAGCQGRRLRRVHQVHGRRVLRVSSQSQSDAEQADALWTDDPACVASVRVADCVPILLARADGQRVAAVHAGWRGVVAGVIAEALDALRQGHNGAHHILAAVGPCIGPEAFEVGPEVLDEFRRLFPQQPPLRPAHNGKGFVDLRQAVYLQLLQAGLAQDQIDLSDRCTCRDQPEFYSHRRDRGLTGRLAAIISPA